MSSTGEVSGLRIVVGIDGSPSSLDALGWAARQAQLTHAPLTVLFAWEWPNSMGWAVPWPDGYDPAAEANTVLEDAVEGTRQRFPDVEIRPELMHGHPAPTLVEASDGAALLVVGSRGHGEFVGMVLGSVGEHCATHAHCPVLVYRSDASAP